MSINNDKEDTPVPCQNAGCTFWGRAATEGLCSKCFNAKQKEQQKSSSSTATSTTTAASSISPSTVGSVAPPIVTSPSKILVDEHSNSSDTQSTASPLLSSSTSSTTTESAPVRKVQENKSRCFQCNKKIGLTGIECKCGYVFCGAHRYPDTHSCDFDFKKHDRDLIAKSNEKIIGSKLTDKL